MQRETGDDDVVDGRATALKKMGLLLSKHIAKRDKLVRHFYL